MSKAASDTLEKVADEFEAEVLGELKEGRDEAQRRLDSARKEASEAVSKILETGEKQAESVKRQVVGTAELEARNASLRSLERAVSEVFEAAVKEVSGLSATSGEKALTRLIEEGADVIRPKAKVLCSSRDRKAVASIVHRLVEKQLKVGGEGEDIETIGGVVLTSHDGSVRFDNTFAARLERMRPSLRKEVADILTAE